MAYPTRCHSLDSPLRRHYLLFREHHSPYPGNRRRHRRAPHRDGGGALDSVVDLAGRDTAEDRRRLDAFAVTGKAVALDDIKAWVASWDSADELSGL
jgi:hypothetical protein